MNGSDPETRAVTAAWIPLCSYARSRRIDQESQAAGLEETWLMGQAALSSAHAIRTDPDLLNAGTMHILCGPGNNGGDGLALAYMLIGMRHIIASIPALRIYQTGEARSSAAQFYAGLLREIAQSPIAVDVCLLPSSSFHFSAINNGDVIVDALLGTGQDRAPAGEIARLLAHVALARIRIACALLALDVPTGLREDRDTRFLNARELRHLVHRWRHEPPARNSDSPGTNPTRTESNAHPDDAIITGLLKLEIDRWLPAPDEIHSYGVMKLALELNQSLRMHSRVHVLPIGFHPTTPAFTSLVTESATRSDPSDPAVFAPSNYAAGQHTPGEDRLSRFLKSAWHHKYGAGHGLFIGGSIGMEGAALLVCRSFFAAGGGILHGCVPAARSREFLTADFPATMFRILHTDNLRELTPRAVCIGPGLSPADAEAHAEVVHAYLTELMATHTQTT
ncbi:MAG: hypothetical protein KDK27_18525, partial [Leptospiraceae bacterium]|nr:hypothetical protein [Leptospiraceae bacterium]